MNFEYKEQFLLLLRLIKAKLKAALKSKLPLININTALVTAPNYVFFVDLILFNALSCYGSEI
ncbi:MAG: hypothetical protein ACJAZP_000740 [Psychromonas sp.]|jgi:hypothetical protein